MAWGRQVTRPSLAERSPHCGWGTSTPAVPHPHLGNSNYRDELKRCSASRPAPGDGQGAEGLESDEARGISGAHTQAVPIGVCCHKGVAEFEDGRLQNHRNAQLLPLRVKTIDVGTLDVAETQLGPAYVWLSSRFNLVGRL